MIQAKRLSLMISFFTLSFSSLAQAQMQNIQLERLIQSSQQEVEGLKEMLKKGDVDTHMLESAARTLEKISAGIDESIEPYQGTKLYTQALVKSQADKNYSRTFSDVEALNKLSLDLENQNKIPDQKPSKLQDSLKGLVQFQKESVKANNEDLANQEKLRALLKTAPPGFADKVRSEIEISNWQTNTRLSAQATELLSVMHAIREELRLSRTKNENTNPLNALIIGSDLQNEIQKGKKGDHK